MSSFSLSAPPPARIREGALAPIAAVAILFWLFSYALFTTRVQLRGDEGMAALFTFRRLLATAAGAVLYAAVLRFAIFPAGRKPAHPLVLVVAVIPAAAAMVAVRVIVDPLVSDEPLPLATHLRWVLVWAGYFGLWLIGFTAWRKHSEPAQCASHAPSIAAAPATPSEPPNGIPPLQDALADLIEALAEEAAGLPQADRRALLQRLGAGYAVTDDPLGTAHHRNAIITRVTARIPMPRETTG